MAHNYHPHCGCGVCCDIERADEDRDEAIAEVAGPAAKALIGAEDFAWGALVDLPRATAASVLQDVGRFFERYHALADDATPDRAMEIARDLYRDLLPTLHAAATAQATDEAAMAYDRRLAA